MEEQYRKILILLDRAGQIEIIGERKKEEEQFINVTLHSDCNESRVKEEIATAVLDQFTSSSGSSKRKISSTTSSSSNNARKGGRSLTASSFLMPPVVSSSQPFGEDGKDEDADEDEDEDFGNSDMNEEEYKDEEEYEDVESDEKDENLMR